MIPNFYAQELDWYRKELEDIKTSKCLNKLDINRPIELLENLLSKGTVYHLLTELEYAQDHIKELKDIIGNPEGMNQ